MEDSFDKKIDAISSFKIQFAVSFPITVHWHLAIKRWVLSSGEKHTHSIVDDS